MSGRGATGSARRGRRRASLAGRQMAIPCDHCGGRVAWAGTFLNQPSCRACGHRPPPDLLAVRQAEVDRVAGQEIARDELDDLLAVAGTLPSDAVQFIEAMHRWRLRTWRYMGDQITRLHRLWQEHCGDRP